MSPPDPDRGDTLPQLHPPVFGPNLPPDASRAGDATTGLSPADAADPIAVGATFAGRYRIDRLLGRGGMGTVYLAHDTRLDCPVALKIPRGIADPASAARFLEEARAAAGLRHPNICLTHDAGRHGDTHYLCMQYIPGEPLSRRVGPGRPVDPAEAVRVVRAVARAMDYAHGKGVVHRDLKPSNILVDDAGEPVVMDFGLARRGAGDAPRITLPGTVLGTPAYMPPEQVAGDQVRVGPRSDVYALGAVLYELLTGSPPFAGDVYAVLSKIATAEPEPPSARRPGLDPRFDPVVLTALAKDPDRRWATMRAFADALAPLAADPDAPALTLRVVGTTFAYRPPPGAAVVTVGRQRRKPGEPADAGNDVVLRVAGSESLSARISRRHFEVRRAGGGFEVVDRSRAGLTRNGGAVPRDVPVPLADGDVLGVAGVVSLEVRISRPDPTVGVVSGAVVEVPAPPGGGGAPVRVEASLGDIVTADD
ncbi:MAG: hypothetical protein C0501_27630 [Isosphaera sp.]|nr:hypothetical protein [Isosphaera sp.]